ncbi:hypothetical protein PVK06_005580 [Gossypium arboreum]|uniref:Uncharacterized protein n=1 Tax=Gossypium arboreum TaxID=29729 RepID=A0ABR0QW01_GOSAR|nr:hypothetical protein PVK06_005580 [Gossypium arboreum]
MIFSLSELDSWELILVLNLVQKWTPGLLQQLQGVSLNIGKIFGVLGHVFLSRKAETGNGPFCGLALRKGLHQDVSSDKREFSTRKVSDSYTECGFSCRIGFQCGFGSEIVRSSYGSRFSLSIMRRLLWKGI